MNMKYDNIIIGSGPGGYVAAIRSAQLGFNTAVVERSELGGICLNWGCIPTKALLKSAQALHYAQHSADYGFSAENVTPDLAQIVARSRNVSATMNKGVEYLLKKNKVSVIRGTGKVLEGKRVSVDMADGGTEVFDADRIIIATGSHPAELPFAPIDGEKIWCYYQALAPQSLPKSLAVIGSGAIGTELAFFYHSLGVEVTIIEFLDRVLPIEDDDVCAQVSRSLRKAGIKVMVSSSVKSVDTTGDICRLTVETKKGEEIIEAEKVLSAVGVRPNTEGLGLEALGVQFNRGKIVVDDDYRAADGIYAIGDVIATPALAHVASAEAVCCVEKMAGLNPEKVNYDNIPGCTYITPEVASVGMTERKAKELGISYKVGKFPFTASGKATAAGARDGFVKLVVDEATDKVLGAHLVGEGVAEMIGGIVVARNMGVTSKRLIDSVFPHPTMSEAIMEAAAAAHNESIHI